MIHLTQGKKGNLSLEHYMVWAVLLSLFIKKGQTCWRKDSILPLNEKLMQKGIKNKFFI